MLPFLKRDKEGSLASAYADKKKDNAPQATYDVMETIADDLMKALESKNRRLVADKLRAAFDICARDQGE